MVAGTSSEAHQCVDQKTTHANKNDPRNCQNKKRELMHLTRRRGHGGKDRGGRRCRSPHATGAKGSCPCHELAYGDRRFHLGSFPVTGP